MGSELEGQVIRIEDTGFTLRLEGGADAFLRRDVRDRSADIKNVLIGDHLRCVVVRVCDESFWVFVRCVG